MISKTTAEKYVSKYFRVFVNNDIINNMELIGTGHSFSAQNFEEMASEIRDLRKMIWPGYNDATTQTRTMRLPVAKEE